MSISSKILILSILKSAFELFGVLFSMYVCKKKKSSKGGTRMSMMPSFKNSFSPVRTFTVTVDVNDKRTCRKAVKQLALEIARERDDAPLVATIARVLSHRDEDLVINSKEDTNNDC